MYWWSRDGRSWHRVETVEDDTVASLWAVTGFRGMAIAVGQTGVWWEGNASVWVNENPPPSDE